MGRIGGPQLILIVFIVLLLFGSRRLPDLAGALGRSMKEFRKETSELGEGSGDGPADRREARGDTERGDGDRSA
jgi:sec-independent protein translocase protein TatA